MTITPPSREDNIIQSRRVIEDLSLSPDQKIAHLLYNLVRAVTHLTEAVEDGTSDIANELQDLRDRDDSEQIQGLNDIEQQLGSIVSVLEKS